MPMPLAGKTALITGAARGIGRATAHKLAAAGCAFRIRGASVGDGPRER